MIEIQNTICENIKLNIVLKFILGNTDAESESDIFSTPGKSNNHSSSPAVFLGAGVPFLQNSQKVVTPSVGERKLKIRSAVLTSFKIQFGQNFKSW